MIDETRSGNSISHTSQHLQDSRARHFRQELDVTKRACKMPNVVVIFSRPNIARNSFFMTDSDELFPTIYKGAIEGSSKRPDDPQPPKRGTCFREQGIRVIEQKIPTAGAQARKLSQKETSTTSQPKQKPRRRFDPVRLSAVTREFINDPVHLPTEKSQLLLVRKQLLALQDEYLEAKKYSEAQQLQKMIRSVELKLQVVESRAGEKQAQKEKYAEVKAVLGKILDEWNASFDQFVETTEGEIKALQEQQRKDLEAFDATCPEELTSHYRRVSPDLLIMRNKEKALAANRRFLEAQKLKQKNDAEEGRQEQVQFTKMHQDWVSKRKKFIAKQDEQMKVFLDHAESTRVRMLRNRDQTIVGYVKRLNLIDEKLGDEVPDLDSVELSDERRRVIDEIEAAYPVPRIRGAVFTSVRQKKSKSDDVLDVPETEWQDEL